MEKDSLDHLKEYLQREMHQENKKPEKMDSWGPVCSTCKKAKWGPSFTYSYCKCSKLS